MSERIDYAQVAPRGVKALGGVHLYVSQSGLVAGAADQRVLCGCR